MSSSPIPIATQFRISMKDVEEVARFFLRRVFRFPASSISACVSVCQDLEENMFITPCLVRAKCNLFLLSKFLPQWSHLIYYINIYFQTVTCNAGSLGPWGVHTPLKQYPFEKRCPGIKLDVIIAMMSAT